MSVQKVQKMRKKLHFLQKWPNIFYINNFFFLSLGDIVNFSNNCVQILQVFLLIVFGSIFFLKNVVVFLSF